MLDAAIIFCLLALILPLAALKARHLSSRKMITMATIWVGIFVLGTYITSKMNFT